MLAERAWCLPSSSSGWLSYQCPDKLPEVDKHMGRFTKSRIEIFFSLLQSFLLKEVGCGLVSRCRNSSRGSTSSLLHVYIYIYVCIFFFFCSESLCSLLNAEVNPPTPAPVSFLFLHQHVCAFKYAILGYHICMFIWSSLTNWLLLKLTKFDILIITSITAIFCYFPPGLNYSQ